MKPLCFARNQIIPSSEATLHPMDIGLIRGYGIFDFFRTENFVPLFLTDYLDRFIGSAQKTYLPLDLNKETLRKIILELIERNDLRQGGVRMVLSGGMSENHFSPATGDLFIFCEELMFPGEQKYNDGVKLSSTDHVRSLAEIKTTNYTYPVWLSKDWKKNGAEDVIYHHNGMISESSRSNIFIIKNGEISTPDQNILHGITRKRVLELGGSIKIEPIGFTETLAADEIFMTSTTKKILPVTRIDDQPIGNGKPGKITRELIQAFKEMEQKNSG